MPLLSTRQKVTIAKLLNRTVRLGRSIVHKPMQGEFTRNGLRWHLDLNEGIDLAIYLLGAFERDLVRCYENIILPGTTVLDIGANIGAHTLPIARAVGPNGKVIAIEATEYAFQKLLTNLGANPEYRKRVIPVHSLLVADLGNPTETHIHSSWPLTNQSETHPLLAGALKPVGSARVSTLDQIVSEMNPDSIGLVKLDVDGHELPVLQGSVNAVRKYRPPIAMELAPYCYADKALQFEALIEWLHQAGYVLRDIKSMQTLPRETSKIIQYIPRNGSINILARQL